MATSKARSQSMRIAAAFAALAVTCVSFSAFARVQSFPTDFKVEHITTHGATIYVRVGGKGPAVVILRGMGLSSQAKGGYDKKTQATDIATVMDKLNVEKADLVTHDIGNMVGYALAAQYPDRITKWVVIDAPLPGIGPWDEIIKSPLLWHFNFRGPDVDRLVKGRERIYLDRFYNELSADPKAIDEATRRHYAKIYARPGAMHAAFNQFAAFAQDASDNKAFASKGKLTMPILALGAEKSFGEQQAAIMREVGTNVEGGIIANSGHWIMEEQPDATVKAIRDFLEKK